MKRELSIVVAAHFPSLGIGFNGQLPWKIAEDMTLFQALTSQASSESQVNAVIMGRKTWSSIPARYRPLKGRRNVVLSSAASALSLSLPPEVMSALSLDEALAKLEAEHASGAVRLDKVFVIGGEALFKEALASPSCRHIYLTEVFGEQLGPFDTFLPAIPAHRFTLVKRSALVTKESLSYRFSELQQLPDGPISAATTTAAPEAAPETVDPYALNPEEGQYLRAVRNILDKGVLRGDRTGTGTLSLFGIQMRFSLRQQRFPLLTTKRVFWRGVAEELLWIISGATNAQLLQSKGVHIWDGNASRAFLDARGLPDRQEGDLGPVYGFQWRHFGAKYTDMHADYSGQGIDQLQQCIDSIRSNPSDRRIVLTAWNPADLALMALPPCHMFCQFYVADNALSCLMYQRSADMGLGVPFNIASYALLTRLVAQVCGLEAGELVHCIGDAHVYCNHVEALREQLQRSPKPFPKLQLLAQHSSIDDFKFADLLVEGYEPLPPIQMQMAV